MKKGFTLAEMLVAILLVLLLVSIIGLMNYRSQIFRSKDVVRKSDLNEFHTVLEFYYKEHSSYPPPDVVGVPIPYTTAAIVCEQERFSTELQKYASRLPCDPDHDRGRDYVYQTTNNGQDYLLLARLENENDPAIDDTGCRKGCSYIGEYTFSNVYFNYAQTSRTDYPETPRSLCNLNDAARCTDGVCVPCSSGTCQTMTPEERGKSLYCYAAWCKTTTSGELLKNCP